MALKDIHQYVLLNESIFVAFYTNGSLKIRYNILNPAFFLSFITKTKKFVEESNFGERGIDKDKKWWREPHWIWGNMGEEDENQTT